MESISTFRFFRIDLKNSYFTSNIVRLPPAHKPSKDGGKNTLHAYGPVWPTPLEWHSGTAPEETQEEDSSGRIQSNHLIKKMPTHSTEVGSVKKTA